VHRLERPKNIKFPFTRKIRTIRANWMMLEAIDILAGRIKSLCPSKIARKTEKTN
jgi:hypothetical protein